MAQLQTKLIDTYLEAEAINVCADAVSNYWVAIFGGPANETLTITEYDHSTRAVTRTETANQVNMITNFSNGDSFDFTTLTYTFAEGQPNRFQTPTLNTPSSDVDTGMGANYYEEDLTTNVKKYFAEAFKFDGSQFEMDGDRIVGLKQSFIDSLAIDLTNIVNTSIKTATLEADMATINQTLTALGINTDLLKTKDLRLVDAQGHEHKLHLGN